MEFICKTCESEDFTMENGERVCINCKDDQDEGRQSKSPVNEAVKRHYDEEEEEENGDDDDDDDYDSSFGAHKSEQKDCNSKRVADDEEEDDDDDDDDEVVQKKRSTEKSKSNNSKKRKRGDDEEEEEEEEEGDSSSSSSDSDGSDEDIHSRKSEGKGKIKDSKRRKSRIIEDDEEEEDEEGDDDEDDIDEAKKDDEGARAEEGKDDKNGREDNEDDDEEVSDDEDERAPPPASTTMYDFDIMMAKKKEENSRKRKRRNYDIINDNDDIIADIINQMKDAVEADNEANKNKMAATRKLKLLPFVISQLRKVDLRDAFLDSDVLSVITEWLAPLPDRSLPHLNIRENLLKILIDFNLYDVDRIKASGIGKAIMYLYKHPKESKENKQRAKQLISCWSRPIFQLDSSFNSISREEREQRDLELMSKQKRVSKQGDSFVSDGPGPSSSAKKGSEAAQKPGDKGWIPRARVPAPSMRDYVIRPRSKVDGDIGKNSKRPSNMLEKYMKNQQERRRAGRQQRAVNMKIDRV